MLGGCFSVNFLWRSRSPKAENRGVFSRAGGGQPKVGKLHISAAFLCDFKG